MSSCHSSNGQRIIMGKHWFLRGCPRPIWTGNFFMLKFFAFSTTKSSVFIEET